MKKKTHQDQDKEIDLRELFILVLNNKLKLLLMIFLPVLAMYLNLSNKNNNSVQIYETTTEILPITTFEEYQYKIYNNYLDNQYYNNVVLQLDDKNIEEIFDTPKYINYSVFIKIDKILLNKLFLEKLNDIDFLIKIIRNFNFIKKENYENSADYEIRILNEANKFKVISNPDDEFKKSWFIKYYTTNPDQYKNFLKFLEAEVNSEIRYYLSQNFRDTIKSQEEFQDYLIEEITNKIKLLSNTDNLQYLLDIKKTVSNDKSLIRLEDRFNDLAINNLNSEFLASKLIVESTKFISQTKRIIILPKIIATALVSTILSLIILYYLRKNKKLRNPI